MLQTFNLLVVLRFIAGGLIAAHGIYRILFLKQYTNYVSETFDYILPFKGLFEALIVVFPFVEFFVGSLLILNIAAKESIKLGVLITLIIMFFLILNGPSVHMFYHILTLGILYALARVNKQRFISNSEL